MNKSAKCLRPASMWRMLSCKPSAHHVKHLSTNLMAALLSNAGRECHAYSHIKNQTHKYFFEHLMIKAHK